MTFAPTMTAWSAAAHAVLTAREGRVVVLVDAGLPEAAPVVTAAVDVIGALGRRLEVHRVAPTADLSTVARLHELIAPAAAAVVLGGGTLLDAAKLARLWAHPGFLERLTTRARSGFVALRPTMSQPVTTLVAVPTTLGTGSESSPVAIADIGHTRRLVSGAQLQPDAAVLRGDAASTLPESLQREGVAEVLLRLANGFVGDGGEDPLRSGLVPQVCHTLAADLHGDLDDADRARVLRVGALSHHSSLAPGNPYGARAWYVGAELSAALGIRKMAALPALTIAAWRRIEAGDERWGHASALAALHAQGPVTGGAASEWLRDVLSEAGVATSIDIDASSVPPLAERVLRHWGRGLPMLPGLDSADVQRLLREASEPDRPLRQRTSLPQVAHPVTAFAPEPRQFAGRR